MIKKINQKFFIKLTVVLFYCFLVYSNSNALENKILFKVNNEIVTSIDVINEIEYLSLLNNNLKSLDKEKIFEIAKNSLLREKIKTIELSKTVKISEIDQKYTNVLLEQFMKKLNLKSKDEFKNLIKTKDLQFKSIEHKLKIELLWNQLILNKFSQNVKIDKKKN